MKRSSLMGSSKYEHDPLGLDRDINNRAEFFKTVVDPIIADLTHHNQITPDLCVEILKKNDKGFLLTFDGVDDYIWNNWDRLHEVAA